MSRPVSKPTRPTVARRSASGRRRSKRPSCRPRRRRRAAELLLDQVGLCVAARNADFIDALLKTALSDGKTTAIGHSRPLNPYDACLINGSAAHGEDFDDTFEGGPIHSGSAVVPAALALAEHRGLNGHAMIKGIIVGMEISCRGSMVAPMAIHRAGFHPSGVLSALGAAAGGAGDARARQQQDRQRHGHCRQLRLGHHRISFRRQLDQAVSHRLGRAIRCPRGAARGDRIHPGRFPSSKARTDSSRPLRRTRNPITANCSMTSAPATWSTASRSSRSLAAP